MNLGDFRAGRQAAAPPATGAPGGRPGVKNAAEMKTHGPFSAPASFGFFSASSHFPKTSTTWVIGRWRRQEVARGTGHGGPRLKGRMFMETGCAESAQLIYNLVNCGKRTVESAELSGFFMNSAKAPKSACLDLAGAPWEGGFPDAAVIWSTYSRVRNTDPGSVHPGMKLPQWKLAHHSTPGRASRPFLPALPLSQHTTERKIESDQIAAFQNLLSSDKNKLQTCTYLINLLLSLNRISPTIRKKNILLSVSFLQWFI